MPTESMCWSVDASWNLDDTLNFSSRKVCTTRCGGSRWASGRRWRRGSESPTSSGKRLDGLDCFGRECQVAACQILFHVFGVGGTGQRQNPYAAREAEHDLGGCGGGICGEVGDQRMV